MSVDEALAALRQVGTIENRGGVLKARFPESARAGIEEALATIRTRKGEALARLLDPDPAEMERAVALLNRTGVRIMRLDGIATIGVWSDVDGPEVRTALGLLGMGGVPVRFLDGDGIPERYKVRKVAEK